MNHPKQITLCAGSACWTRGNRENLQVLESLLAGISKPCEIRLGGCHCRSMCQHGPILFVDGNLFTRVTPQWLEKWIRTWLDPAGRAAP